MINTPDLDDYCANARNNCLYDFKATNGTSGVLYKKNSDFYRGMPLGVGKDGVRIFASARDVGNMGAGIVARKHHLPWFVARLGFDGYQSRQYLRAFLVYDPLHPLHPLPIPYFSKWQEEGVSTQNAQRFGYNNRIKLR